MRPTAAALAAMRAAELIYWVGRNPLHQRLWHGQ
jgi:hypothetical protein